MNIEVENMVSKISGWHHDRNLISGSTDKNQMLKLVQEYGELCENTNNSLDVVDDIGDMLVVLINLAVRNNQPIFFPNSDPITLAHVYRHTRIFVSTLSIGLFLGDLSDIICKERVHPARAIDRVVAELVVLSKYHNHTILECLEHSWNDIKDRKGMMVDGIFVKEDDLT